MKDVTDKINSDDTGIVVRYKTGAHGELFSIDQAIVTKKSFAYELGVVSNFAKTIYFTETTGNRNITKVRGSAEITGIVKATDEIIEEQYALRGLDPNAIYDVSGKPETGYERNRGRYVIEFDNFKRWEDDQFYMMKSRQRSFEYTNSEFLVEQMKLLESITKDTKNTKAFLYPITKKLGIKRLDFKTATKIQNEFTIIIKSGGIEVTTNLEDVAIKVIMDNVSE